MKIILVLLVLTAVYSIDNGVGRTPPLGWNSWNHFGCNINENLIKQTADLLVSSGLAAKGYKYVNLDDCWQVGRNSTTNQIIPDSKFPSGMAALGDYIHSKGLLFGLYSDAGHKTCAGRPGSLGLQTIDAQTYAKWGVDYLKYDNCNTDGSSPKVRYPIMRDALNKTGRKIFYSMCQWGVQNPATWAGVVGNSWRTTGDISDNWNSFINILNQQAGLEKYAGPGGWNDPDMLEVGNGGMTTNQDQAHFALWAALKSPLLIGCDLNKLTDATKNILGNEEIIAINQDPLGVQVSRIRQQGTKDYWTGPLANNKRVMILLNRDTKSNDFTFSIEKDLKYPAGTTVSIRDAVNHTDLGNYSDDLLTFTSVETHSVRVLVISTV